MTPLENGLLLQYLCPSRPRTTVSNGLSPFVPLVELFAQLLPELLFVLALLLLGAFLLFEASSDLGLGITTRNFRA